MTPRKITIHCSATPNGVRYEIDKIRNYHVNDLGWSDVGYHIVIQPNGDKQQGRALNVQGAHVSGHNRNNIGICLIGLDKFTAAQFVTLHYQLDSLFLNFDIPKYAIYCHRQFDTAIKQGKTCPNMDPNRVLYWYTCKDDSVIQKYIYEDTL